MFVHRFKTIGFSSPLRALRSNPFGHSQRPQVEQTNSHSYDSRDHHNIERINSHSPSSQTSSRPAEESRNSHTSTQGREKSTNSHTLTQLREESPSSYTLAQPAKESPNSHTSTQPAEESPNSHTSTHLGEESTNSHTSTQRRETSPYSHTSSQPAEESPNSHTSTHLGEASPNSHTSTQRRQESTNSHTSTQQREESYSHISTQRRGESTNSHTSTQRREENSSNTSTQRREESTNSHTSTHLREESPNHTSTQRAVVHNVSQCHDFPQHLLALDPASMSNGRPTFCQAEFLPSRPCALRAYDPRVQPLPMSADEGSWRFTRPGSGWWYDGNLGRFIASCTIPTNYEVTIVWSQVGNGNLIVRLATSDNSPSPSSIHGSPVCRRVHSGATTGDGETGGITRVVSLDKDRGVFVSAVKDGGNPRVGSITLTIKFYEQ